MLLEVGIRVSDKTYNILFPTSQILLPAAGSIYFLLGLIIGVPGETTVLGVILILNAAMGIISRKRNGHHDGKIIVTKTSDGKKIFTLELDGDPDEIEGKDSISFKVVPRDDDLAE